MKNKKIKLMCISGIFAAFIFVFTAYIHVPVHTGYTHIGDGFIYIAASLLPLPYGIFAGAVGAALADFLSGYVIYAPASAVIKALTVLCFSRKSKQIICTRNFLALIPSLILCVGGYYIYEVMLTQNFISPLAGVIGNVIQTVLSSVLFVVLGIALDKFKTKSSI